MNELISGYLALEKALENAKNEICHKLNLDNYNFEWIVEGENTNYQLLEPPIILDGYKYSLVSVDNVDHEYHYALYVEKINK